MAPPRFSAPAAIQPEAAPLPDDGDALRARLGSPDFVRREMNTELWRYDLDKCAVFFFMQKSDAMLRVRYTETLPHGMGVATDPDCIRQLELRAANDPDSLRDPSARP